MFRLHQGTRVLTHTHFVGIWISLQTPALAKRRVDKGPKWTGHHTPKGRPCVSMCGHVKTQSWTKPTKTTQFPSPYNNRYSLRNPGLPDLFIAESNVGKIMGKFDATGMGFSPHLQNILQPKDPSCSLLICCCPWQPEVSAWKEKSKQHKAAVSTRSLNWSFPNLCHLSAQKWDVVFFFDRVSLTCYDHP